jgi:hypothetical protein
VTNETDPALPAARILWPDITDSNTREVQFLGNWTCFYAYQTVAYEHLVQALEELHHMLDQAAAKAAVAQVLPGIDKPLNQLIDFTTDFGNVVAGMKQLTPTNIVQGWEQRLQEQLAGAGLSVASVDLDFGCSEILADIRFTLLAPDQWLSLNASTGDFSVIDISGSGQLHISSAANVTLKFGIDLGDTAKPRAFLDDASEIRTTIAVNQTQPLNARATVGPLGVWIKDGVVVFDIDGEGPGTEPAKIDLTINDNDGDGRHYLDATRPLTTDLQWQREGKVFVQLPLYYPTMDEPLGGIDTDDPNDPDPYPENQLVLSWDLSTLSAPTVLESPDLGGIINSMDLLGDPTALLAGLEIALSELHSKLNSSVFGAPLPLVGKSLKDTITFVNDVKQAVVTEIGSAGSLTSSVVKQALYNALGPSGLGLLSNINQISIPSDSPEQIEFQLTLSNTLAAISVPIDVGILGFELDGNVSASVNYAWNLGFGISKAAGFYLKDAPGDDLTLGINVSAAGLQANGRLGFLTFTATADASTGLQAGVGIDLKDANGDGKLRCQSLRRASSTPKWRRTRSATQASIGRGLCGE